METEYLGWFANALNFIILVYLISVTVNTSCFSFPQSLIATIGLFISIIIQLGIVLIKRRID